MISRSAQMALLSVLAIAVSAQAVTLKYDFGHRPGDSVDAGVNVVLPSDGTTFPGNPEFAQNVANSIDTGSIMTGVSLTIQNDLYFNVANGSNGNGTTAPTGDAATHFSYAPDENLTSDALYGHTGSFAGETRPSVEYLIEGLDANGLYDFTFYADRGNGGNDRSAAYTVDGSTAELNPFMNTSDVAQVLGAQANGSGALTLTIGPGSTNDHSLGFYYLGAMDIVSVPEPSTGIYLISLIAFWGWRRR